MSDPSARRGSEVDQERYIALRREGYDEFGAGVELKLRSWQATAYERAFKAAIGEKPRAWLDEPMPAPPTRVSREVIALSDEGFDDRDHVKAVLKAGGYPRGSAHGWRGPDGKPWRGWV